MEWLTPGEALALLRASRAWLVCQARLSKAVADLGIVDMLRKLVSE